MQELIFSGDIKFASVTYRMFKMPPKSAWLPAATLTYNGDIEHNEEEFKFDFETTFKVSLPKRNVFQGKW